MITCTLGEKKYTCLLYTSANDIRELENLNPLSDEEGGNLYLVNGNMVPITMAAAGYTNNAKQEVLK